MLGVAHVNIADDVNNTAVGLLGQALVLAAIAGLHMENGNVQTLCAYNTETGVGVTQHQHRIRIQLNHKLIGAGDDVTHGLAKVVTHGVHIDLGSFQFKVVKENTVKVVVVVLTGVSKNGVKISAALFDDFCQTDNFRPGAYDDKQLKSAVVFEGCSFHLSFLHFFKEGVGVQRVKCFIGPHKGDKIFCFAEINNVMCIAGQHVHGFYFFTGYMEIQHLVAADSSRLNKALSRHYDKELPLAVVPVLALGNTGQRDIYTELTVVCRFQKLGKAATGICVHFERECRLFPGEVGKVC